MPRGVRDLNRQTIIDWRARGIGNPTERLKFLRERMGPDWPDPARVRWWERITRHRWHAPALAGMLTVVVVSGVLVSAFEFHHTDSMPMSRSVILAPPVALSSDPPNDSAVWLVDRKGDVETYSNGLRIETRFVVSTQARGRYRVFPRSKIDTSESQFLAHPAGIVFHTTESAEAPFQAGQDRNLKRIGQEVLLFVQQNRCYHFVIDRFGRVFRIVKEEDVAYHSGNSVWADQHLVYVGLNTSFLAVAIETQTRAGQDTASASPAQIYAVRVLTNMLRSKYHIDAANCVTHAQVSINPVNKLIGYHTDWAANFPFQAIGLPDNYMQPPASMVVFGFSYDPGYLHSTGTKLLPGLLMAESEVRTQAARLGLDVPRYRAQLQARLQAKLTQLDSDNRLKTTTKEKEGKNHGN
ncbi:MAG: peptidoglycan recognition protein family protein [Acidobacteriota bacterium]|nr:peptidoglycan recognition protein family protein [Acidobacteriota bacterium]